MITENKIFSSVETITPTVAAEYLKSNNKNRTTCPSTIEAYARAMRNGKWSLNGDTIVFDTNGNLINGQHRLMACIKADVPFQSLVARNVENEAFATYDCGRHRTAGQLIGIDMGEVGNSNMIASAIPLVDKLRNNKTVGSARTSCKRDYSNSDIVRLFNEDVQGFIDAASLTRKYIARAKLLTASMTMALIYYLWKEKGYEKEKVSEFFEGIMSYSSSPVTTLETLRTRLVRYNIERDKRRPVNVTYNLVAKTWNAWVTGKEIKSVAWTDKMPWTQMI